MGTAFTLEEGVDGPANGQVQLLFILQISDQTSLPP
jgi:hypothetical protein